MSDHFELLSYTQINEFIGSVGADESDLFYWSNPTPFTRQEQLIEYAGRVCYQSTDKMGQAPSFIKARINEGHEDIIEHVSASISVPANYSVSPLLWRNLNPYCTASVGLDPQIVSANLRVWLHLIRALPGLGAVKEMLAVISPSIFNAENREISRNYRLSAPTVNVPWLTTGQARVTLLGINLPPPVLGRVDLAQHGAVVFLIEGVSRSLTHQLVRHRRFSFSQVSQRYVELTKGAWRAIVPDAISADPGALADMNAFWERTEETYAALRGRGIRKEDARAILPNATETRLVVSGFFEDWLHFNELRSLDKAAQGEIRAVGQTILHLLAQAAPAAFAEQAARLKTGPAI